MIIECVTKFTEKTFKEIKAGECFKYGSTYFIKATYFIKDSTNKIDKEIAINLNTGMFFEFNDDDLVYPLINAKNIVHSKWINGDPICPVCGEDKFKGLDADIWADWKPKYCPNCGTKMEETNGEKETL